jgi:hypothetical protein
VKFFLLLIYLILSGCQLLPLTSAVEPPAPKRVAYDVCFPKDYKPLEAYSHRSKNGGLYWQVVSVHTSVPRDAGVVEFLYFRTNGDCQRIGYSSVSKLEFMPRDAAIGLSRQQHEKQINKCIKKKGKPACIKEFNAIYATLNDNKDESQGKYVVYPEDVEALKQLGIIAEPTPIRERLNGQGE